MNWTDLITHLFDYSFASRWTGTCSGWTKELTIAHVIADCLIWLSYMTIPILLVLISRNRKDLPFNIFFLLFAAFIIGCGMTHFMGAITAFIPLYYLDFWVKAGTAVASLGTAWFLWRSYPKILNMPNPFLLVKKTEEINRELSNIISVFHTSQDAIVIIDKEGKVTFWNDAAEKMFLWTREEILGKQLEETIIPLKYSHRHIIALQELKNGIRDIKPFKTDLTALTKDGKEFPIEISICGLTNDRYAGIIRDYSEHAKYIQKLEQANKDLDDFALIAAHDLQDPLRQNSVFIRFLKEKKYDFLDSIEKNNIRMLNFIRNLLTFARSGGANLSISSVNLNHVLKSVIEYFEQIIADEKITITVGTLPIVDCDMEQITRVFQNLIKNAIRYASDKRPPEIHISVEETDEFWKFYVKDNGTGINKEQLPGLFTVYRGKKLDNTGVGFGLAICKRIIGGHGGSIWVETEGDKGSCFIFTLPIKQPI